MRDPLQQDYKTEGDQLDTEYALRALAQEAVGTSARVGSLTKKYSGKGSIVVIVLEKVPAPLVAPARRRSEKGAQWFDAGNLLPFLLALHWPWPWAHVAAGKTLGMTALKVMRAINPSLLFLRPNRHPIGANRHPIGVESRGPPRCRSRQAGKSRFRPRPASEIRSSQPLRHRSRKPGRALYGNTNAFRGSRGFLIPLRRGASWLFPLGPSRGRCGARLRPAAERD